MRREHLRNLLLLILAALILVVALWLPAATGATTGPPEGYYCGAIELPGRAIETRLNLALDDSGGWTAAVDFPSLQISRMPAEEVTIDDGSQLYLSLRLATLEWRMETSEPMPFIVDDILINFDDERSRATLETLARFSRKNQVILFTHHRQLVDDAVTTGKTEEVVVHMLEQAGST